MLRAHIRTGRRAVSVWRLVDAEIELINRCGEHTLAGVAQWIERWPANQCVAGSIPSQGTRLACRPGPWTGVHGRQPHIDVFSLSLSPSLPLSKNK